jgi:hypothetical protein
MQHQLMVYQQGPRANTFSFILVQTLRGFFFFMFIPAQHGIQRHGIKLFDE